MSSGGHSRSARSAARTSATRWQVDRGDDHRRAGRSRRGRDRRDQRKCEQNHTRSPPQEEVAPPSRAAHERAKPMVEARGESGVGHVTTLRPRADGRSGDRAICGQPPPMWTTGVPNAQAAAPVSAARRPPRQDAAAAGVLVFAAGVALASAFSVFFSVGRRARRAVGARLRLRHRAPGACAAVRAVEPAALEDDPHRREHLPQLAAALGADGERRVGERLHGVEPVIALGAGVLVGGHCSSAGWHSRVESASITREGQSVFPSVTRPAFGSSAAVTGWSCGSAGRRVDQLVVVQQHDERRAGERERPVVVARTTPESDAAPVDGEPGHQNEGRGADRLDPEPRAGGLAQPQRAARRRSRRTGPTPADRALAAPSAAAPRARPRPARTPASARRAPPPPARTRRSARPRRRRGAAPRRSAPRRGRRARPPASVARAASRRVRHASLSTG